MEEQTFRINFNSLEPITFKKFENGKMNTYGYSIERDINGFEVKRTDPMLISSIGYDNGEPFTEKEYNRIMKK